MVKKINKDLEMNQAKTSLAVFMGKYNISIPNSFSQATEEVLNRFQATHPSLFKGIDTWSIEKHRKRFMDWILLNHD